MEVTKRSVHFLCADLFIPGLSAMQERPLSASNREHAGDESVVPSTMNGKTTEFRFFGMPSRER